MDIKKIIKKFAKEYRKLFEEYFEGKQSSSEKMKEIEEVIKYLKKRIDEESIKKWIFDCFNYIEKAINEPYLEKWEDLTDEGMYEEIDEVADDYEGCKKWLEKKDEHYWLFYNSAKEHFYSKNEYFWVRMAQQLAIEEVWWGVLGLIYDELYEKWLV